ncbi:hypothetical protein CHAB381_A0001 (plasmid) [Campylobacter hominis ATCC BAA-381]|uniref:Uncharacterized protein n=1 Tax=Campylobacter hominis (strain ATCC BAA-381 / DSM 21671 / CCUG 45161 / LMG 19568 / NCTC 13146 / CH001A) TaxID=360107 RepID=A7HZC7_CAMHC|nr:hypothetical protein CHAB381_A0001 [Campylobacter hominis ATCC BAA-381]
MIYYPQNSILKKPQSFAELRGKYCQKGANMRKHTKHLLLKLYLNFRLFKLKVEVEIRK